MKTIQELRDDLNHKVRTLADLRDKVEKENRAMSPEEQSDTTALFKDIDDLKKDIKTIEEHEERMAKIGAVVSEMKTPEVRKTTPAQPGKAADPVIEVPSYMVRYGKMKAFKDERSAYISGQWYRATFLGDYRAMRWCQENGVSIRAQNEGANTAGGALVPDQLSAAIIDLREIFGVFRRECGVVPMGSESMAVPRRTGGLTAYFTAEAMAITESEKTWNQVNLIAKKLAVLTRMSTELSDDAIINVADDLASEIAYAFANKEDLLRALNSVSGIVSGRNTQTLQGSVGMNYLGYPVVISQVLPAGATTDYTGLWMLGFGDLGKACSFGERRGISIKRSDERYFVEDQIALKGTERIDINVHDLGTATAAGPFVSLIGGA